MEKSKNTVMHSVHISKEASSFCHPDIPFFDKTGAAVIFPAIPVLLGVEDVLFSDQMIHFTDGVKGKYREA